ncbi:MAG: hypothetical protein ABIY47_17285 [Opitutaceae bacterium]
MSHGPILLYFGHTPMEGAGSAIIVLRHLQRFAAEGWDVRIVPDWGQDHALCHAAGWPVKQLSHRRPWWPLFNPDRALSRNLRTWLWAGETQTWLGGIQVDGVLTYLSAFSDTLSLAAVGFARRYRLPLATLIHDDTRCFAKNAIEAARAHRRRQWILEHSTTAWFASPELAACYDLSPEQIGVLPPIPEGVLAARGKKTSAAPDSPLLVYAGNYWPPQLPTLAVIGTATRDAGGRLLAVIKENSAHVTLLRENGIEWRAPWPRNTDALDYFREHASAVVVSYAPKTEDMPWTRTSFPSKLIEYCHLGLPIVIVAAEDTAVVRWARARNFPDVFAPSDTAGLGAYVQRLRDPVFCAERAALSRFYAEGEFDPVAIQRRLSESLLRK